MTAVGERSTTEEAGRVRVRLRPVVHASPTRIGLHVRGWASSFTVDGGPGVWRLWRGLDRVLADGVAPERLGSLSPRPEVQAALDVVLAQLREHDLLVEVPEGWPADPDGPAEPVASWLSSVAADPADAWGRLRSATFTVRGGGVVAAAARRALVAAGVAPELIGVAAEDGPIGDLADALRDDDRRCADPRFDAALVVAHIDGNDVAAAAGAGDGVAFAGAVHRPAGADKGEADAHVDRGHAAAAGMDDGVAFAGAVHRPAGADEAAARARADGAAVAARLGLAGAEPVTPVLAALVGAAAAHRVICAVAGLPDPGTPDDPADVELAATGPASDGSAVVRRMLVARLDPLRADYHPWIAVGHGSATSATSATAATDAALTTSTTPTTPASPAEPPTLVAALAVADLLTDPDLGPLPPARVADVPQLPAGLAGATAWATTDATGTAAVGAGVGATPDTGRLLAVLAAAEHQLNLGAPAEARWTVGIDRAHAAGVLLRRLAVETLPDLESLPESVWAGDATARRWHTALTLRFGVPAEVSVTRVGDELYRAVVTADGVRLAAAVEGDPADAVAFATLEAVGVEQWRQFTGDRPALVRSAGGATPTPPPADLDRAPWQTGAWSWPERCTAAEPAVRARLSGALGHPRIEVRSGEKELAGRTGLDVRTPLTTVLTAVRLHPTGGPS